MEGTVPEDVYEGTCWRRENSKIRNASKLVNYGHGGGSGVRVEVVYIAVTTYKSKMFYQQLKIIKVLLK